jgi:hypothetical protein
MRLASHNAPDMNAPARPAVTVFCAVWHKQPNKLELLKSHWENLKQQSVQVEPCYIFDNGDTAPDWLDAPWHSFSEPLTIYEAWSAGVALARTRYVMNLNMDDRLATNAAEIMLSQLQKHNATLIGGEWIISFDHAFQTQQFPVSEVKQTSFEGAWPPKPLEDAQPLRLGSGTGERGTFGPATLWDLNKTGRWYPSYFGTAAPILSIGDSVFWRHVMSQKLRMARLPLVVGRYYSSPDAQAEFRPHNDEETLRTHGVHKVSFAQQVSTTFDHMLQQAPKTLPIPRNKVETQSRDLAAKMLALFGQTTQAQAEERRSA